MLRRERAGLKLPKRDPFTASILDMLEDVGSLRTSLLRYTVESQLLVEDLRRLANSLSIRRQQRQQQHLEAQPAPDQQEGLQ
ncbi:hypothetical protein IW152_004773 [Coemansia sp. BCRC 34962]|nr:hypothetical protein IW152_004773 [Coemansia sp. BCRC 34962]